MVLRMITWLVLLIVTPRLTFYLQEALLALRRAWTRGNAPKVKAILQDVRALCTREAARAKYRRRRVRLGEGMTITTAEGQMTLAVVLDNPLAEDILADRLGYAIELNGPRNGMKRKVVDILAAAIQAVNGEQAMAGSTRGYPPLSTGEGGCCHSSTHPLSSI